MKLELVLDEVELPWAPAPEVLAQAEKLVSTIGSRDLIVQVVMTDDATLQEHNREYRAKDRPTDVLSFSYLEGHESHRGALLRGAVDGLEFLPGPRTPGEAPLAGQILLSLETLSRRGPVHAERLDEELLFMIVHGLLHVLGYDHDRDQDAQEMEALELELMRRFGQGASDGRSPCAEAAPEQGGRRT